MTYFSPKYTLSADHLRSPKVHISEIFIYNLILRMNYTVVNLSSQNGRVKFHDESLPLHVSKIQRGFRNEPNRTSNDRQRYISVPLDDGPVAPQIVFGLWYSFYRIFSSYRWAGGRNEISPTNVFSLVDGSLKISHRRFGRRNRLKKKRSF